MKRLSDLSKLFMFLLTDGGMYCGDGKYEIYFVNSSNILLNYFKDTVEMLSHTKIHSFEFPSGQKVLRLYDKNLFNEIQLFSNTMRTKPCDTYPQCPTKRGKPNKPCKECIQIHYDNISYPFARIPDFIFKLNLSKVIELLKIAMSSEGYVTVYFRKNLKIEREIGFSCNHPLLKRDFKELFKIVGIKFSERKNRLFISNRKEIQNFRNIVGFVPETQVSKSNSFWFGIPKNEVLRIALLTYEFPKGFWKTLGSQTSALEFLKGLSQVH